ncbi:aldehyde dehydrogenase family protein [Sporichthya brevicatena]|uniref:aldehyde dehydrogenase (NAD(+)) n=1 Tax=Sporichthya brevicatena TaxID=171442 RepID=A0ABP3SF19_9ACTN
MPTRDYQLFVGGEFVDGTASRRFASVNPATGAEVASFVDGTVADLEAAVAAARRAFDAGPWPSMPVAERAQRLGRVLEILGGRVPELSAIEYQDNGATIRQATSFMVPGALGFAMGIADLATKFSFTSGQPVTTGPVPGGPFGSTTISYEPLGVVGAITPWNGPLILAMWKVWPALLAGNTVVLKPSELAPSTAMELARAFAEADIPPGVLNVVTGGGTVGEALVSSDHVDMVTFTGGTATGQRIAQLASGNLKRLTLELGGKSPALVLDDVDIESAVDGVIWSTLFLSGQMCTCASRVLVNARVHDEFVERFAARADKLVVGPTDDFATDLGPVVSAAARDRIEGYVQLGTEEGAVAVLPGGRPSGLENGFYVKPTVFVGATPRMRISREEIFGPVVSILKVADDAEAVQVANDTQFGLAASVWCNDRRRALDVAGRVRAGTVWINDHNMLSPQTPFGGMKMSGSGRENGESGFKAYLEEKVVYLDLTPSKNEHLWALVAP